MDWDKIVAISTIWLIVGAVVFVSGWYALIPAATAVAGTVAISRT